MHKIDEVGNEDFWKKSISTCSIQLIFGQEKNQIQNKKIKVKVKRRKSNSMPKAKFQSRSRMPKSILKGKTKSNSKQNTKVKTD